MSQPRILFVNDFASTAFQLAKYMTCQIDVIYFKDEPFISSVKNKIYFKGNFIDWIKQIKELAKNYDLLVCLGWPAATICYLAGVNYMIYFVDAYIDPEARLLGRKMPEYQKNLVLEIFDEALKHSIKVVALDPNNAKLVQKYRPDRLVIFPMIDPKMFNTEIPKIDLGQDKFTFFSPTRIEEDKGQLVVWEAINLTRSDFVVLQTDWGRGEYYNQAIAKKPDKVKIIPKIVREQIPSYYISADAMLGQLSKTTCSNIERESILCGIPVFCGSPLCFTGNDPFYTKDKDPAGMAEYIDKIVLDENFRKDLVKKQHEWALETFDIKRIVNQWDAVFAEAIKQKKYFMPKLKHQLVLWLLSVYQRISKKEIDFKFLQGNDLSVLSVKKTQGIKNN